MGLLARFLTDAVLGESARGGPGAGPVYAAVFPAAIVVKVRDNHVVQNRPAYLAIGIDGDGEKNLLGILDRQDGDR